MSRPRVGLLHYTCPPVIGGVETVLMEQATRLRARGFPVTVLAGRGGPLAEGIRLAIIPELDSKHPEASEETIVERLTPWLDGLDVLIVHNALTLHFNLPLTGALWRLADRLRPPLVSWCHDLSWTNPLYRPQMQPRPPWSLLRQAHPRILTVCVSEQRRREWLTLTHASDSAARVIPNGVDPVALLGLQPGARTLIERFQLDRVDAVLLAPVRITKRKNLEWAIAAAAHLRDAGRTVRLLITGPPGPHNPDARRYVDELRELRQGLQLDDSVRFLFDELPATEAETYPVSSADLRDLYMLSDVVVMPSSSEGFGLPIAEAALFRVPVVCADLPAFREIAPDGPRYVPAGEGPAAFASAVAAALQEPSVLMRRRVLGTLSWERIIAEQLDPLVTSLSEA